MPVKGYDKRENLNVGTEMEQQMKEGIGAELTALEGEARTFYELNTDKVTFKDEVIKNYLTKLKENMHGKTSAESWLYLMKDSKRFSTCIIAMQIALEKKGFEIGKIDGILGGNTRAGILRFQNQCDLKLKDGLPGQETITELCKKLDDDSFQADLSSKPDTVTVGTVASSAGGSGAAEQQAIATEGKENIAKVNGKKCKVVSLGSIEGLPSGYTRNDPKNYNESKGETYPTVYQFKGLDGIYTFYSNGRCKCPDGTMTYTKAIAERVGRGFDSEGKYRNELHLHMGRINQLLEGNEVTINGKNDSILAEMYGSNVRFYLKSGKTTSTKISQGDYVGTQNKTTTTNYKYYIDLGSEQLLDAKGNFDKDYFKNVILQQVKNNLESQYKAESVMRGLYKMSRRGYSITDIFGEEKSYETAYLEYFNEMNGRTKKITFRKASFRRNGTNIKFDLDQDGNQESYNKLTVDYKELSDSNGNFSEDKLKAYLKKKVTEIVDKHFRK